MPETTAPPHATEAYFPTSSPGVESAREAQAITAVRTTPGAVEAAHLLLDSQQLLLESRPDEAEPLLRRALELYEREDDPRAEHVQTDVAAILGSLARVYLHSGQFAKAEALLQRLLQIKRARGDDHPEVATVLASLATAHSAMGAHESAERILRRVLAIRERTLAPNHFATMTTLEHLADACAARGKFGEALALLHQALTMRERTLGLSHPSIGAARTRIGDLELLASNEELGAMPMRTPVIAPRSSALLPSDARPDEAVETAVIPAAQDARAVNEPLPPTTIRALDDEWQDDTDESTRNRRLLNDLTAKVASAADFARTSRGRATFLAIGVASLISALVLAMRARADESITRVDAAVTSSPRLASAPASADKAVTPELLDQPAFPLGDRRVAMANGSTSRPRATTASVSRSAASERPERAVAEDESTPLPQAPRVRSFDAAIDKAPIAPVSAPLVASVDFTQRAVSVGETQRQVAAGSTPSRVVRAILPSDNPTPEYPRELIRRRIEGRVVAEFLVDVRGRVDSRTIRIVSSTDERFSQAVLDVLPKLRFLPAERDGVKTEEWVEMPFRFAPKPE